MTKLTLPRTRQCRFLRAFAKSGSVAHACRVAGLYPRLAYRWHDRDSDFARRWKEAAARAADLLRGELPARALIGRERIVYRYRPMAAHCEVRREIFGSASAPPPTRAPDLAERLREAEVRMVRYHAEIGVTFPNTHFQK